MIHRLDKISRRINEVHIVLIIALLSRLTVLASSTIGFTFSSNNATQFFVFPNSYLGIFGAFDGDWYKNIALFGYPVTDHLPSGNWAFFPLYPFLMNIGGAFLLGTASIPLPTATTLSGLIISNALFYVSAILFYKLSKLLINNKKIVLIAVAFFCFWGSSFFYSAVYSESLFMTLSLSAFYLLEKGQTTKSTLFGFFAGLTRSSGFIIAVPFIYNGLQTRKYRAAILQSIAIFLPYILFNTYGYIATGTFPVREITQKTYWTPTTNNPITTDFLSKNVELLLFFAIVAIIISAPIIYFLVKERISVRDFVFGLDKRRDLKYWALTLVALVMLVFVVIYAQPSSILRYAIIILPMYWVSASIWSKNSKLGKILLFLWIVILAIGTAIFASGEPFIL